MAHIGIAKGRAERFGPSCRASALAQVARFFSNLGMELADGSRRLRLRPLMPKKEEVVARP